MLQEVEQTVDDVVIIANGRSVAQGTVDELSGEPTVIARSPRAGELADAARRAGVRLLEPQAGDERGTVRLATGDAAVVGDLAFAAGVPLHGLVAQKADLESLYFRLTSLPSNANRNLSSPGAPADAPHPTTPEGASA